MVHHRVLPPPVRGGPRGDCGRSRRRDRHRDASHLLTARVYTPMSSVTHTPSGADLPPSQNGNSPPSAYTKVTFSQVRECRSWFRGGRGRPSSGSATSSWCRGT